MSEGYVPLTADQVFRDMMKRKHRPDAKTRKKNKRKRKLSQDKALAMMAQCTPLTAKEVAADMESGKRCTYDDVPIEEQRRVGDLVRANVREAELEQAAIAFGLANPEPAPPKPKQGRPTLGRAARTRCITHGCPFTTKKPSGLCKRCAAHVNTGNLPKQEN